MKKAEIKSFAKINLTLDVLGILPNGFHEVSMVMQQIGLSDNVSVEWSCDASADELEISLSTNKGILPLDERNLAYKAALIMAEEYNAPCGSLHIDIQKHIPVAAGLAGGSGNGAAVIHALNLLWDLNLPLEELCKAGAKLGSDVPFCIMGQAAANDNLKTKFADSPLCCHCALATGTGTDLKPLAGLKSYIALSKPPISVSTAEVYKGIDNEIIELHPDNDTMIQALMDNDHEAVRKNLVNVLENFTLKRYPIVTQTKSEMQRICSSDSVLMSGSGPTVFAICKDAREAEAVCSHMRKFNEESYFTHTTC